MVDCLGDRGRGAHRRRELPCDAAAPVAIGSSSASVSLGGPYGNGPYRETASEPDEKIVASLAEMAEKLRNLPNGHGLKIDWTPLDEATAAGKAAAASGDHCTAIRRYAEGLRVVMQQIRQHRLTATDDSGVYPA